jgi:CheY-like chemotaxis protein
MDQHRHILVVEDDSADYELITHELEQINQQFSTKRIESLQELEHELDRQTPDVVLCDHGSAKWDSLAVLEQVRARNADVPFILVTGDRRGAAVTRALASGADDLVLKDQLVTLGPAIHRAMRLAREIRLRRQAEWERDRLQKKLSATTTRQTLPTTVRICAGCKKIPDGADWIQLEQYFRRNLEISFSHGLCPVCVQTYYADFR